MEILLPRNPRRAALALAALSSLAPAFLSPPPLFCQWEPGPGDDPRVIIVRFADEFRMSLGGDGIPADRWGKGLRSPSAAAAMREFAAAGGVWTRMSGASEDETDRLTETAARTLGRGVARLNNYFILAVPDGADAAGWRSRLAGLPGVDLALFTPRPVRPPVPGSFQPKQGYLNGSANGIDANYAWSLGDSGQHVTVCDFEYSWNLSHQDLPSSVLKITIPGWTPVDPFADSNHGTAVLGEMASRNNGWGTTGAAYGASFAVAPTNDSVWGWQIGTVMTYAMTQLSPGDVFLVEQQMGGPRHKFILGNDTGLVPIEWFKPWYDVVVTAVGNGFHVVEAAGNGYQDLDSAVYSTGNGGHYPFRPENNSGAIIVGAGAVPPSFFGTDTARSRLDFSNYGSRLDLQGWGEFVVTTGYGRLYNAEGVNLRYDSAFAGTSSASPIVASAVALVEGRYEGLYAGTMGPTTMRALLVNTGLAQKAGKNPVSQKIGPMPNLNAALVFASNSLAAGTYQVGLSRTYADLGAVAAALAGNIVQGHLVFELQGDYSGAMTETYPVVFTPFTAAGGNWTVRIRPAAGVTSRLTSGAPPPYQPVIHLNGAVNITLDGRPGGTGQAGDWLIRNTRKDSTGPAILIGNGADHNTLRFLQVESQCSTANSATISFGRQGDVIGTRKNVVAHNVVRDRTDAAGAPQVAIGAVPPGSARHDSNEVTGNEVFNWKSAGMSLCGDHWRVDSNSLYAVSPQSTPLTGILFTDGDGHTIADNAIGGSAPGAGGGPFNHGASGPFTGIALTVDTLTPTVVERNLIRNIVLTNTGFANFFGISGTGSGKMTIRHNVVGDSIAGSWVILSGTGVASAISLQFVNDATVEGNLVTGIRQTFTMPGEMRVINLSSTNDFAILENRIHGVGPLLKNVSGNVRGIYLDTFIDSVLVANNMVSLGFGDTNDVRYDCIYDASMSGMLRVFLAHNSLSIGGIAQFAAGSGGVNHAGMSPIRLRNNAVANIRSGGGGVHHALLSGTPALFPGASDNNVLYNLNPGQLNGWLGAPMGLAMWVLTTSCDGLSANADPKFVNSAMGNLHVDSTVWSAVDNAGVPLATVPGDFDGQPRIPTPDVGADEYTISSPGAFALISPANNAVSRPVSGSLTWGRSAAAGSYDLLLDTLTPPVFLAAAGLTDTSYAYSGLDTNRNYYWKVVSKNSSASVVATGSPRKFSTGPGGGPVTVYCAVDSGWNMVSIPMEVEDAHWLSVYPIASSRAYDYAGSYRTADTIRLGKGYWVKCSDTGTVAFTGEAVDRETVLVSKGWNIIGSISDAVTASSITSDPGGLVTSDFYGYDPDGYDKADTLRPGEGYWVKASGDGILVITTDTAGASPAARIRIEPLADLPPAPPEAPQDADDPAAGPIPERFAVGQNYPNPFNGGTAIRLHLPERSNVSLAVYDLIGREVARLADGVRPAGVESIIWDGTDGAGHPVTSGVYFARITAASEEGTGNSFHAVLRLVFLR